MKALEKKWLKKREEYAIEDAARIIKSQFPVEEIILFGSKARGDHDAFSDIDLLLVTTKPLHWKDEKAIVEILFDIGMTHDVIFSPCLSQRKSGRTVYLRSSQSIRKSCEMEQSYRESASDRNLLA
jgi:predicted nucleotidyltransferase